MSTEAQVETVPVSKFRTFLNRLIFRAVLFCGGIGTVLLYLIIPNKSVSWRFARFQAWILVKLCGVRVNRRGFEKLEDRPYIYTPNHQSHFDIAALISYLPGCLRFAAKKELFREPVLGFVLRKIGMIPIDRENSESSIRRLGKIKNDGYSTVIFPEGTRSKDGTLLPFKKGAFVAAIELGIPVVPVVCKGGVSVMPKGKYLSILPGDVELVILDPIDTSNITYEDRDRLREQVRELIAEELER